MSTTTTSSQPPPNPQTRTTTPPPPTPPHAYFNAQRAALISDISLSFDQVLKNINKLNRSLEAVIDVGNEFSSVEALWSQFENVMGKDPAAEEGGEGEGEGEREREGGDEKEREEGDTTVIPKEQDEL